MKKFAILALAALAAVPSHAAGVTIGGYIDVGYVASEADFNGSTLQQSGSANGTINVNDGFQLNEVNIDVASQLTNDISAFASIDFVNGGSSAAGNVGLDYAYIDVANPGPFDLNVRLGRIPSVIGIEQRVSESNQSIFVNRSLLSQITVGSQDGLAIYGSFSPVNYAISLSNADNIGDGDILTNLGIVNTGILSGQNTARPGNNNGSALANGLNANNSYNVSGRLGVVPIEGLEVGASAGVNAIGGAGGSQDRTTLVLDASYSFGAFGLKGEWAKVTEDPLAVASNRTDVKGFYVEGTYDYNSKVSFGGRYSSLKTERTAANFAQNDFRTIGIVGVYRLADNVMVKAEYDINDEGRIMNNTGTTANGAPVTDIDNDAFALSVVGSF